MDDAIAKEKTLLLDRKYTCPICNKQIRAKSVKSNSAKFVDTMADLRPIYSNVNVTKYDTVCCPNCGYSALTKNFTATNAIQQKLIQERIQANYKSHEEVECDIYTTEVAISRMKMALLCTIKKDGKNSEIGNVCMKLSWLYQSLAEEVPDDDPKAEEKRAMYIKEADNAALNAYENLSKARMMEDFPIAGMNETTLDYILAYYAYKKGDYQICMQYLSNVVSSRESSPRLKDKALELKDLVGPKLRENK